MPDIICPLFNLPDHRPLIQQLAEQGIVIRHARPWERTAVYDFVTAQFSQGWADEVVRGFNNNPVTILLALKDKEIVGFSAYEVTARAYFGPTGVTGEHRHQGIGKAVFLAAMYGLRELGYVYGIIGAPGPVDFYLNAAPGLRLPAEWTNIYSARECPSIGSLRE